MKECCLFKRLGHHTSVIPRAVAWVNKGYMKPEKPIVAVILSFVPTALLVGTIATILPMDCCRSNITYTKVGDPGTANVISLK